MKLTMLGAALFLAFTVGRCTGPEAEVEVKVIEVPTVRTVKSVQKVEVTKPFPRDCVEMVQLAGQRDEVAQVLISSAPGRLEGLIGDAMRASSQSSVPELNVVSNDLRALQNEQLASQLDHAELSIPFDVAKKKCDKELK